ncbi:MULTISPECIES: transposase [unclassified Microcoleus]|uniref:transposase n=1 Tax=unclassified Microcoleus TaxID=2642155 RepID=UPI002FD37379
MGSRNIAEQQYLISPVKELLKDYEIIILGDREFGSVKLASWLCEQQVKFVLRIKQERYIESEEADYVHLSELGLLPRSSFDLTRVKVTQQKGFSYFDVAGYWSRKYLGKVDEEGWYLLTNLG